MHDSAGNIELATPPRSNGRSRKSQAALKYGPLVQREFRNIVRLHQNGNQEAAQSQYLQFLDRFPDHDPCLHMMGVCCLQGGDFAAAQEWIGKAIAIDSEQAVYFNNYGAALHRLDLRVQALCCFHRALEIRPQYVDALSNLGLMYDELGQWAKAASILHQASELEPDNQEVQKRFIAVQHHVGDGQQMVELCEELIRQKPTAELHSRLGNLLVGLGKTAEAEPQYRQALELDQDNVPALFNLANTYHEQHRIVEAKQLFRKAAIARPRNRLWGLRELATCPVIWSSASLIDEYCEELSAELDRWIAAPPPARLQEILTTGAFPNFSFAYLGRNVVDLKHKFSEFYQHYFQHYEVPRGSGLTDRIRVGFLVTKRHEGIFIRCLEGILRRLNPERFDVLVFCDAGSMSKLQISIPNNNLRFVTYPQDLEGAAAAIRAEACDILYFWEVGSDSLNYFLPFCRLAPVQCTSHGSQITTGNPWIEHFYSSSLMELDSAQTHYAEKLWNSETLLMYQTRLTPPPPRTRGFYGLPDDRRLYLCLQNPLKMHPDFDEILTKILREDERAMIVLLRGSGPHPEELLRCRFDRVCPDVADRIAILPNQVFPDYLALIRLGDVLLDPLHFGWGSSAYDCFSFDQPLVTLPTQLNVGRVAKSFYTKMGVSDLVAADRDEYAHLAIRLGRDREYSTAIREKISGASGQLFEDQRAVIDHERFFEKIFARNK